MLYYLIENMMGFEKPVEEGSLESLTLKKKIFDTNPATSRIGSDPNEFVVKASYYIVPKHEWDLHDCPLIPVDLS